MDGTFSRYLHASRIKVASHCCLLSSAVSSRGLMDEVFSRCLHAAASVSLVIAVCYQVLCPAGAGWMNCSPCACMQLRQCYQPLLFAIKCCVQ